MWLFLAFLAVPIIEIALFIQVGGAIGLWPTLLIVIVTAVLGTYLVREQGKMALGQVRSSFSTISDPTEPLAHGAMIIFAGAMLLTPGFFTDAVGFALLVPALRHAAFRWLRSKITVQGFASQDPRGRPQQGQSDIIEAEYHEIEPDHPKVKGDSSWVQK
ncbi:MAG: FxsA family protein [Sulfitobacter sp.]